jgi:cell filamentation protein
LRNKFTAPGKPYGEPDPDKLRQLEEAYAHTRLQELYDNPCLCQPGPAPG